MKKNIFVPHDSEILDFEYLTTHFNNLEKYFGRQQIEKFIKEIYLNGRIKSDTNTQYTEITGLYSKIVIAK